jgi:exosortase/archaeosortase family protein
MNQTVLTPGEDTSLLPDGNLGVQRLWPRTVVLVATVLIAYRYSLAMTIHSLGADSPLAYLGLVPLIALCIGFATVTPRIGEPEVHDRYLDRIIAVPSLVLCSFVMIVLPSQLSSFFWLWRIDLLTLPLFVAGMVALLFGARSMFRVKAGILFLLLAWPVPYQAAMQLGLEKFTEKAVSAVGLVVRLMPVATPISTIEGGFKVNGPGGSFDLVVASACSGANGLLGFLIIAGAALIVSTGRPARKALWLTIGGVLVWVFNVLRIVVIFSAGKLWGQTVAVDGFHPFTGLVTFSIAIAIMVWLMPRFGLVMGGRRHAGPVALAASVSGGVPHWRVSACVALALSVLVGAFNSDLRDIDPVISALGAPRVSEFADITSSVSGFEGRPVDKFEQATRFFGEGADWTRFEFAGPGANGLSSQLPVTADVVTSYDAQSFNDFGVENCYRFHGFDVTGSREVDLGKGQTGTLLSWKDPRRDVDWTALFWYWPVAGGDRIRYQRIVLLLNTSANGAVNAPDLPSAATRRLGIGIDERLSGSRIDQGVTKRDREVRPFVIAFARRLIDASTALSPAESVRTSSE